jgi:hypothetical protein
MATSATATATATYNIKGGYYEVYDDKIVNVVVINENDELYSYEIEKDTISGKDTIRKDLIKKFQNIMVKKSSDE